MGRKEVASTGRDRGSGKQGSEQVRSKHRESDAAGNINI